MEHIPVLKDEPTTDDCPLKVWYFGWVVDGKARGYGQPYRSVEGAARAAGAHKNRTGKVGHHVVGVAIGGFAF